MSSLDPNSNTSTKLNGTLHFRRNFWSIGALPLPPPLPSWHLGRAQIHEGHLTTWFWFMLLKPCLWITTSRHSSRKPNFCTRGYMWWYICCNYRIESGTGLSMYGSRPRDVVWSKVTQRTQVTSLWLPYFSSLEFHFSFVHFKTHFYWGEILVALNIPLQQAKWKIYRQQLVSKIVKMVITGCCPMTGKVQIKGD